MAGGAAVLRAVRQAPPDWTIGEQRDSEFIDELIRVSDNNRTEALGPNYFEYVRQFFLFRASSWQPQLEYQIKLRIPELLTMFLEESFELSEPEPVFFVMRNGARQDKREDALHTNWRATRSQREIFKAHLWSMMCHTGFLQVMVEPGPPRQVRIAARNPQNIYADPFASDWKDWQYVVIRVPMAPDEIVRTFPWAAGRLPGLMAQNQREMYNETRTAGVIGSGPESIELPPGAMQSVTIGRPPGVADFMSVDYVFIKDDTREAVAKEIAGAKAAGAVLPPPSTIMKYPSGRLIVRCSKLKLYDGPNQYRRFPIIPCFSLPPLYGIWGTPPLMHYIQMQHLVESMLSQNAENIIRMNYGYRLIQDGAILNPEALEKLGGILRVKNLDDVSKAFRMVSPTQFSSEQNSFPNEIMQHMRDLFGRTASRQGNIGAGNISPGLFEAGVAQSQAMTRMRGGMLADTIEDLGALEYETMVDYLDDTILTDSSQGSFRTAPWEGVPLDQIHGWNVKVDAASVRPISRTRLQQMVLPLINLGLPLEVGLKWLDIPDLDTVVDKITQQKQAELQAMAMGEEVKKRGGGKKK